MTDYACKVNPDWQYCPLQDDMNLTELKAAVGAKDAPPTASESVM